MQRKRFQKRPARITLRYVMDTLNKRLDSQDTTLLDVINHMSHMEQRLTARLDKHDGMFVAQGKHIDANTTAIGILGRELNQRIDQLSERISALDEDLVAVMKDTIVIRRHVGIPVPEEA